MSKKTWETYEEVAQQILDDMAAEFGLVKVEGKQLLAGRNSGTEWEIDAKGLLGDSAMFVIVECRRHTTSRLKQEEAGALAWRILDTGAAGGIIVSSLGLHEGAAKVAASRNIISVTLGPNSTTRDYVLGFLNKVHAHTTETIQMKESGIVIKTNVETGEVERQEF